MRVLNQLIESYRQTRQEFKSYSLIEKILVLIWSWDIAAIVVKSAGFLDSVSWWILLAPVIVYVIIIIVLAALFDIR